MTATAQQPAVEQPDPDMYANTAWMIGEIVLAYQILGRKINETRKQNEAQSRVGQKLAAEETSKLAEQLKVCSDIVVNKSTEYVNRRSRP